MDPGTVFGRVILSNPKGKKSFAENFKEAGSIVGRIYLGLGRLETIGD
jgi:hypothetical protein